ncbi:hypothetical protein F4692_001386 [Nocardioides cavernae]|uniref:PH domain-containing protein n=1 Tax=Nocardioides cavernae TaxID=1921566 RepID=A0A7Y9KSC4_9ACTN|nr:hypothetical protein [Nocardioides cavernae]NYE36282.1 hypothetical protein [Nocardioides cavernae]
MEGTELPQRHTLVYVLVAAAVVLAVPCARMAWRALGLSGGAAAGGWAMTVVMVGLLVVVPLLLARSIQTRHTYVSDEAVTVVRSGGVSQRIAFADLTEVRVRFSGRGGDALRNDQVFLLGPNSSGRAGVVVSRFHVDTLQPLLQRLAAEVERRPGLLATDVERSYFQHALTTAP